ncbi:MAG: dTMP kinase [Oligosphaeraceae bacterium]|nr:dTMP kinase [Oligosphaeraceae bacterium]
MKTIPGGLLFSFEGPDKAGKSTQLQLLAASLRQCGYQVYETREPGGTILGEEIRRILLQFKGEDISPEAELLLFGASRAQLMSQLVLPAMRQGAIVLCDRFIDSTSAYQGEARGLSRDFIAAMHEFTLQGKQPDLSFFLDLDVETSFARLRKLKPTFTDDDRFEAENRAFHQLVRQGFLKLAAQYPQRIKTFDASLPKEELAAKILQEARNVIG